jgi:hypothetical protein
MASSDTIRVRNVYGYGSNGLMPGTRPAFTTIQTRYHTAFNTTNVMLPEKRATASPRRSAAVRRAKNSRSMSAIVRTFLSVGAGRVPPFSDCRRSRLAMHRSCPGRRKFKLRALSASTLRQEAQSAGGQD